MICKFFVETGYWVTLKVERGVYGGEEEGGWRVLLFEQTCRFSVRRPLPWRRLRCHGDASVAGMLSPAWFRSPPGDFARKYGHEKSILNRRPIGFFLFSLSLSLSLSFSLFCRRDTVVFSSVLFDWSLLRHCFSFWSWMGFAPRFQMRFVWLVCSRRVMKSRFHFSLFFSLFKNRWDRSLGFGNPFRGLTLGRRTDRIGESV